MVQESGVVDNLYGSGERTLTVERSVAMGHRLSRYDGLCGNVHGHNVRFDVRVRVEMGEDDKSNMPLDLKDISGVVDQLDHVLVLANDDQMLDIDPSLEDREGDGSPEDYPYVYDSEVYGRVFVFDGDPTCEVISQYVADEIVELNGVYYVDVTAYETDKYSVGAYAEDF